MRWVVAAFVGLCFVAMAVTYLVVRAPSRVSCGCSSIYCNAASAPECTNCCGDPPKKCSMHPEAH